MLRPELFTTVALTSLLSIAQQPAAAANLTLSCLVFNLNLSQQNTVGHLQRLGQMSIAVTGRTVAAILHDGARGPARAFRSPRPPTPRSRR